MLPKRWLAEERKRGLLAPKLITQMMLLSTARFVIVIERLILGAMAIGIIIPHAVVAYATPITTMSALLALTPGNLGIAEWSWTYLLTLWGISPAVGTLYGVSFRILVFAAQLVVSATIGVLFENGNRIMSDGRQSQITIIFQAINLSLMRIWYKHPHGSRATE